MDRFGYKHIPSELNGAKIHRLQNILTLQTDMHTMFDQLELWFETTVSDPQPNVCALELNSPGRAQHLQCPPYVSSGSAAEL